MVKMISEECFNCPIKMSLVKHITPKQLQVLKLISDGESNKDISRILKISEQTVKNHVSEMLNRLKVRDRTQLVVEAMKRGIIIIRRNDEQES